MPSTRGKYQRYYFAMNDIVSWSTSRRAYELPLVYAFVCIDWTLVYLTKSDVICEQYYSKSILRVNLVEIYKSALVTLWSNLIYRYF